MPLPRNFSPLAFALVTRRVPSAVQAGRARAGSEPEPAGSRAPSAAGMAALTLRRPGRTRRGPAVAGAALVLGAVWPVAGMAQTWQLTANLLANAIQFTPGPGVTVSHDDNLNLLNQAEARTLQVRSVLSDTPVGGHADARFRGQVGLLQAFAAASNPYCCDAQGHLVTNGYSNATVQGRFYDTVLVTGAGLAIGTPVSYRVDFDIRGSISQPSFELGGAYSADGLAEVRLRDLSTFEEVSLSWDANRDATGRWSLTLATQVGRSLGLSGMLYAGAYVGSFARVSRSAVSDFYSSAHYSLAPSVAGLNTLGASGHDYLAPVPEPAAWAALLAGLAVLGALRIRRSGLRAG